MNDTENRTVFQHFLGVDVGKETLVVKRHGAESCQEVANEAAAIAAFFAKENSWLSDAYWVVDTTGGWERMLIAALLGAGVTVHRADGRKVKSFARSLGKLAKTDAIDASILARYGHDRHQELIPCELADGSLFLLQNLVTRRCQLAVYAKEEKQRLSGPLPEKMRTLIEDHLETLETQISTIETDIDACIKSDNALNCKAEIMKSLPGIGPKTSAFLLAEMPELGHVNRKEIAAIAGLAPYAYDSGKINGRRTTYGGRRHVKAALFLSPPPEPKTTP